MNSIPPYRQKKAVERGTQMTIHRRQRAAGRSFL